jgi:hypothetical protein
MLDHVSNHAGLDHPWIETHPDYFVPGSEQDLQRQPQNFVRVDTPTGRRIFAGLAHRPRVPRKREANITRTFVAPTCRVGVARNCRQPL